MEVLMRGARAGSDCASPILNFQNTVRFLMLLRDAVADAFSATGLLARTQAHFQPRAGQTDMALAVAHTIDAGGSLVVEAGTGIGKTFAYLVPALLSGERVLLSTATKALQDQLFGRDLPQLVQAMGLALRTALLKGRSSYVCLHRMEMARQQPAVQKLEVLRTLSAVEQWVQGTRTGDLAELPELDERSPLIPWITSTRDNCLGTPCPRFKPCHVNLARRDALAADVVVINHHLFFADVAVRESGVAELLPSVRVVVFDEAHQLNETGVQFLGQQLTTGQLLDYVRDVLATGLQLARGFADWQAVAGQLERAARDLRLLAGAAWPGSKLRWAGMAPDDIDATAWGRALAQVGQAMAQVLQALEVVTDNAPDFVRLHERGSGLLQRIEQFGAPCPDDAVRWLDVGSSALRLVESPLDIAHAMRTRLLPVPTDTGDAAEDPEVLSAAPTLQPVGRERAWVFTSATLGDEPQLRWFTEPCGLEAATVLRVASPFNYAQQAALYVPQQLPKPADPGHSLQLARWVSSAAQRLGGRTLVLTTTLKALRTIGEALQSELQATGVLEVLVQGQWPKRRLVERFRAGHQGGQPGCILVASATFWEGFDVPGDALQLVVIDKLPFPPPGDPLVEARSQRLELLGRSPFKDYALPEAAMALKQGAGRLIRQESDSGVLVVGDTRLTSMGYGRRLLAALPPMRRLHTEQDFDAALQALTRPSTTGLCDP